MQVEMHRINAEIAGPDPPDKGVEIGAVTIKIPAGFMDQVGDLDNVALKKPACVGVGEHDASYVIGLFRELGFERVHINAACGISRNVIAGKAALHGGRRIRAMGAFWHKHAASLIFAVSIKPGANGHHSAKLSVRASFWGERDCGHTGEGGNPMSEPMHQLKRALDCALGLQGMHLSLIHI